MTRSVLTQRPPMRFTAADVYAANQDWGVNCGPAALAAITGKSLEEVRPFLGDFEQKHYTNPTLMFDSLRRMSVVFSTPRDVGVWPRRGLVRIQWHGPWMREGVPIAARYRKTHWVGACRNDDGVVEVFDINCMEAGGWVPLEEWSGKVVPWLLPQVEPKADGAWSRTHVALISVVRGE